MSLKHLMMGTVLCAAAPAAALADELLSDADAAYVAAQEIQYERQTLGTYCKRSKVKKEIKQREADFIQANPDYTVALATTPVDKARTAELVQSHRSGVDLLMRMTYGMPPDMFCPSTLDKPNATFVSRVDSVKKSAAMKRPVVSADPEAALPEVQLAPGEVNGVVDTVLRHPALSVYLHPEVDGRVPVRVHLSGAYASTPLSLSLYDAPVKRVGDADGAAVKLGLRATEKAVKITVTYGPEGVHGTMRLERDASGWRVTDEKIYE